MIFENSVACIEKDIPINIYQYKQSQIMRRCQSQTIKSNSLWFLTLAESAYFTNAVWTQQHRD